MTALLLIVVALWGIFCTFAVLVVRGGTRKPTPKPVPPEDAIDWMKAAAKVAARRHA